MTQTELEIILQEGESYKVEFKGSVDKSLIEEVCAFANASGGRVFIGVNDSGRITGTKITNTARSRIQDTLRQIQPDLAVKLDILGNVAILIVPEGKEKPYSCSTGFFTISFRRKTSENIGLNIGISIGLNETQVKIIELMEIDSKITMQRISEAIGISKRNIEANISDLKKKGIIDRIGSRKNGYWKINSRYYYKHNYRGNNMHVHVAHINPLKKEEQTVDEHCEAVSEFSGQFGAKIGIRETASLVGWLHDMGKNSNAFEKYLRYSVSHPNDHSQKGSINHSAAGGKYIYDNFFGKDLFQSFTAQMLALAICGHHGGLPDIVSSKGLDEFIEKVHPQQDIFFEECVNNFFQYPVEVSFINERFYKSRDEIIKVINRMKEADIFNNFSLHLLVKYLFSCLIDADRLDTYNFMTGRQNGIIAERGAEQEPDALWHELSERLEKAIKEFKKESKIDLLRAEISDACRDFARHGPGVYQLCVPTGGGKTLSSLRYALEHAKIKEFNKERIFYIVPFTTIIDQNAKVIRDILKRDDIILEHHSNLVPDDDHETHKLLTERWNSPIVMTTMVQFLNTLFSDGTRDVRRMHHLANSIIIFDEIQVIPIKCIHLFNSALNFLSRLCNATIILCTATQPLLSETEKPLLLSEPAGVIDNLEERFGQFKRVRVENCCVNGGYGTDELADFVLEKMTDRKSALVIMNTRNAARDLFVLLNRNNKLLPENERFHIYHLSTNMCPKHRMAVLDEIKEKLGNERVICISTQLIEAGVNISFECVVRAQAGLDSIAQAAGRCNRHGKRECGDVFIVNVRDESLSRLPDIKEGKECTERILHEYKENPELFGDDLISPRAIKSYYNYYFYDRKNEMDYNIEAGNIKLFDLLSANTKGLDAYDGRCGGKPKYPLRQAFKTAGKHFCVIDNTTTGVIVPYGRGKELIANINGTCSLEQLKGYIREAQQYSVNLYENDLRKIGNGIYQLKNGGVLALEERFYDAALGVVAGGGPMEVLSV